MDDLPYTIRPLFSDPDCDRLLSPSQAGDTNAEHSLHFNQNEDFFIRLKSDIHVPSIPVHHDVRVLEPSEEYLGALRQVLAQVKGLLPQALSGLSYFFDPTDIAHPSFYKIFKAESAFYLYLFRFDLSFRPQSCRLINPGNNDYRAEFLSNDLYLDSELIPLELVEADAGRPLAFHVRQSVSQTWIGETGKGYMLRGIWMDAGLSKFFTKLFLPPGKSLYPYYPLFCKYKSICHMGPRLDSESRREDLALFHRQANFLYPRMEAIQKALKSKEFSESMSEFIELKKRVPESWYEALSRYQVRAYLNDADMKEYQLEYRA